MFKNNFDSINYKWMQRAIKLAQLGAGFTSPNPLVGAVITNKLGELISEGYHERSGMPHAEAMAFNNLKKNSEGGSIYVNLEPCCHHGKTPPCVDRIISSGIKKVYVSIKDPDKRVAGTGIKILNNAGVEVSLGLCQKEALEINKSFIHKNLTGRAFGVLKWAMTIDGRIGLINGRSKWISNKTSRSFVHTLRTDFDAIIIGGNTLRKDNPLLTSRGKKLIEPLRVVFTKSLDLPENLNLWDCKNAKTLVVYDESSANKNFLRKIPSCVEVAKISSDKPSELSKLLANRGCNKVLWECGPKLATAAIKDGCIQETLTFISPKIIGGSGFTNPITDLLIENIDDAILLSNSEMKTFDNDIYLKNKIENF